MMKVCMGVWRRLRAGFMALALTLPLGLAAGGAAWAQQQSVKPTASVTRSVTVRAKAVAGSAPLSRLRPGESLPFVEAGSHWYKVRLPDGRLGFVAKTWTELSGGSASTTTLAVGSDVYKIHAVDVGTGLAVFIEGPGFTMLYDGGSNDDQATGSDNRLLAYLKLVRPDLTHIDHIVLSHPHNDHVKLLSDIVDAYDVGQVWDSGRMYQVCSYHAFLQAIGRKPGIVYHQVTGGPGTRSVHFPAECEHQDHPVDFTLNRGSQIDDQPVSLGAGAAFTILYRDDHAYPDPNENSLVTRLDIGQVRILLTGDEEGGARRAPASPPDQDSPEEKLLACCRADIKADIQFAGHHGSMTSSRTAFLDAVGAKTFIISSGPMKYGSVTLPDQAVVTELEKRGTLYRTDVDDAACAANAAKVGPDQDHKPGGCDNIVITIQNGAVSVRDVKLSD